MPRKPRTNASLADRAAKYVATYVEVRHEYIRLKKVAKGRSASARKADIRLTQLYFLFGRNPPTLPKLQLWLAPANATAKEVKKFSASEEAEAAEARTRKLLGAYADVKRLVFDEDGCPTNLMKSVSTLFLKNPPHAAQLRNWVNVNCPIRSTRAGALYKEPAVARLYARMITSLYRDKTFTTTWRKFQGITRDDRIDEDFNEQPYDILRKAQLDLLEVASVKELAEKLKALDSAETHDDDAGDQSGPRNAIIRYLTRLEVFGDRSTIRRAIRSLVVARRTARKRRRNFVGAATTIAVSNPVVE